MTDKEFANYLGKILLNCGEDCCSMCSHLKYGELCENQKRSEKLGVPLDDDICIEGMRLYAERHAEEKK